MNEREQLIELISQKQVAGWKYVVDDYTTTVFNYEIADHLLANGVRVQRWIPVTERLPEEDENVLTYRESGCNVEALLSVSRKTWENDIFGDYPVTHWMPLPQPPKEG